MFFMHLRDLSFIWPFREANTCNTLNIMLRFERFKAGKLGHVVVGP